LDFVEASTGLFHLEIQVVSMIFDTHLGTPDDPFSLSKWIADLGRDTRRMWSAEKRTVKLFRACLQLVDHVLDGYLLAAVVKESQLPSVSQFLELAKSKSLSAKDLTSCLTRVADLMTNYSEVTLQRRRIPSNRDTDYESHTLFIQQALILRTYHLAMRHGDSGVVVACLSYFTVWFQSTGRFNYANETIHLTACLKRLWSPELRQYWMENCLINPSGSREGWMACDYLGEYIVREVKSMMHHNVTPATDKFLREVISPLILTFRDARKNMWKACDANFQSQHSTAVSASVDIRHIADRVLRFHMSEYQQGRIETFEAADLYGKGLESLLSFKKLDAHVTRIEKDKGFSATHWGQEEVEVEDEDEEFQDIEEQEDGWLED